MSDQTKTGRGGARPGAGRPRQHETPAEGHRQRQAGYRAARKAEAAAHAAALDQLGRSAGLTLSQQRTVKGAAQFLAALAGGHRIPPPPPAEPHE